MPPNLNFRLPRSHRFFAKNGIYGYAANWRWGPPRVNLGANGVPLGPKKGQNRKKLPWPKIRIFDYPAVIDFSQKMEVTVIAPNHVGDPLGSILGPMGSHWVQKMGQNRKKLPCPKIRILDYSTVINSSEKMEVTIMVPNHGGDPLGSILGPMGSHWVQKSGSKRQKSPCPKIRIFDNPAVIDSSKKNGSLGYGAKSRWDPLGSNLWPMGSHWVKKKMGQNRKKYHAPKFEFLTTPRSSTFLKRWKLRLWRQITVGTP